uniref:peptidylprolyl isomerase n=1 Tax=Syphacia muris TaxID=451379 RepID=A0A0N5AMM9_9BILA
MATGEGDLQKVSLNSDDVIGNEVLRSRRAVSSGEPSSDGSADEERSALSDSDLADALRIKTIATQAKGPSSDALEVECRAEQKLHESKGSGDTSEEEQVKVVGEWIDLVGNGELLYQVKLKLFCFLICFLSFLSVCDAIFQILKIGNDRKPRNGQEVSISVVDQTFGVDSSSEITFILGYSMVIEAWEQSVSSMCEDEVGIVKSSCRFAYGSFGNPDRNIPPNQDMEYKIHLLRIGEIITVPEAPKTSIINYVQPLNGRGKYYYNRKEYDKAIFVYKRCLDLAGGFANSDEQIRSQISLVHSNLAACYAKLDDWKASLNSTIEALKLNGRDKKTLFRQAVAYKNMNMIPEALKSLNAALEVDPNDLVVANKLKCYKILGQKCSEREKKMYKRMLSGMGTKDSTEDDRLLLLLRKFLNRNHYYITFAVVLFASVAIYSFNKSFHSYISSFFE